MPKVITGYRVTVTEAYAAYEKGTGYSLQPWGEDTDYYKGGSEPVAIELPDDAEVAPSQSGIPMIYRSGSQIGCILQYALIDGWAKIVKS